MKKLLLAIATLLGMASSSSSQESGLDELRDAVERNADAISDIRSNIERWSKNLEKLGGDIGLQNVPNFDCTGKWSGVMQLDGKNYTNHGRFARCTGLDPQKEYVIKVRVFMEIVGYDRYGSDPYDGCAFRLTLRRNINRGPFEYCQQDVPFKGFGSRTFSIRDVKPNRGGRIPFSGRIESCGENGETCHLEIKAFAQEM